jgi:hypothetical protein
MTSSGPGTRWTSQIQAVLGIHLTNFINWDGNVNAKLAIRRCD